MQPLNSSSGLVGQDLDEIRASLVTGRLESIIVKLLDAIGDADIDLCSGQGTVDSGCGLGRVSSKEAYDRRVSRIVTRLCGGGSGLSPGIST